MKLRNNKWNVFNNALMIENKFLGTVFVKLILMKYFIITPHKEIDTIAIANVMQDSEIVQMDANHAHLQRFPNMVGANAHLCILIVGMILNMTMFASVIPIWE